MASIDGAPFSDAYLTRMRRNISGNASMDIEASNEIEAFAINFQKKLNRAKEGIDMAAPEAMSFRKAFETLRDEFQAFKELMTMSNPEELREMANKTGEFLSKLAKLPKVGKPRKMKESMPQDMANIPADPRDEYQQ